MKQRSWIIGLCVLSCIIALFIYSEQEQITEVRVVNDFIEIGDVNSSEHRSIEFYIYNAGKKNLEVLEVIPDCRCTVVQPLSRKIIPPEDTLKIDIIFIPNGPGYFQQNLEVKLNTKQKSHLLNYRGRVL